MQVENSCCQGTWRNGGVKVILGQIVIIAEKPDVGTRLAATIGGCMIGNVPLTPDMLTNKRYEGQIKKQRFVDGYLKCQLHGKECIVSWGFGHIAELKQASDYDARYKRWREEDFPFVPEEFEVKLKKEHSKHFTLLKKLLTDPKTEYIINATDADREGELIFDYIYRLSGSKKPVKRLWLSSYTEEAIEQGFRSLRPGSDMVSLQEAGRSRAIADWLIGSNLTVMSTLKYGGYQNMISVGRVQTPTLALLANRENEIIQFKPEDYFEVFAQFEAADGLYVGKWGKGKTDRFRSRKEAEAIQNKVTGPGEVTKVEQTKTTEHPPLLYDLTALQMDANGRFGYSAQKTLNIVQKLYENQLVTYPRTNSRFLKEDLKGEIPRIIQGLPDEYDSYKKALLSKSLSFTKRYFDDSKVDGHYAIIPTYKSAAGLAGDEKKIYDLIATSLVRAFFPAAVWGITKIETTVGGEIFYSSGKVLIEKGWRAVGQDSSGPKEEILPNVQKGEQVENNKVDVVAKKTKAPNRFTEKTLLSAMETAGRFVDDDDYREAMKERGLGTPATRASIIERLIQVKYVERKGKQLIPTEKGLEIIRKFPIEEIKSPGLTGEWEYKLALIERGQYSQEEFIKEIVRFTVDSVNRLKGQDKQEIGGTQEEYGKCPRCGGSVTKNKKGWGCSRWKEGCKFQIWNNVICGKRLTDANIKQILSKGETRKISGFISKAGKKFQAKLKLSPDNSGKLEFDFSS